MKTETPNNSNKPSSGAQNSKTNSNRITVKSAVLNHLKTGEPLTPLDAWLKYGTNRLGAVIYDLRKEGYAIQTDIIDVKASKGKPTAHDARIASYSLIVSQ